MRPYYDDGTCVIYHGDCREVLPILSGVDLMVMSPPYNLAGTLPGETFSHGGKRNARSAGTYFSALGDGYDRTADNLPHEQYVAEQHDCLRACWAALSDTGAIFYNHKPRVGGPRVWLPLELIPDELPLRQIVTWDRGSGFNRQRAYYVPTYEWLLLIARPAFRLVSRSMNDVWRVPFDTGGEHPAPFPLGIPSRAIATTGPSSVCDPFMGSGTTLRAAKDAGVRAVGMDISERYCEIAAKRLGQEVLDLGGAA